MTQLLTGRQALMLRCIVSSMREKGMPPTLREIGHAVGIRSTNGVNYHLLALERKGYIKRGLEMKSRDIQVINTDPYQATCTCAESIALRARVQELEQKLARIQAAAE